MTTTEAKALIKKYNDGTCTEQELELLESWYMQLNQHAPDLPEDKIREIGREIKLQLPQLRSRNENIKLWTIVTATAAATLIAFSTWIYNPLEHTSVYTTAVQDIKPGGNKATIILASGETIALNQNKEAIVVSTQGIQYTDGSLIKNTHSKNGGWNTIITPRGGQYAITLSDGSKITLNAASSLKYPSSFSGQSSRSVQLTGEAFFEIAKDSEHPFIVESDDQQIKVLGTTFNLSNYPTLPTQTTLVEGSIQLQARKTTSGNKTNASQPLTLTPGEQSTKTGTQFRVEQVDTDLATAWKNGKTQFEKADLKTIMQMLERWYGIETVYRSYPLSAKFTGSISLSKHISEVLRLLETTGEVHFTIEGRRVIVNR